MLIFRATSLKYCYLHVLNFYLDNGVMTTPKRRILSFVFTVLSFKKSLLIRSTNSDHKILEKSKIQDYRQLLATRGRR